MNFSTLLDSVRRGKQLEAVQSSLYAALWFRVGACDVVTSSVTRLGDLLDFWQRLKPLATIKSLRFPTLLCNFCKGMELHGKGVEIFNFSNEIK